jgi:hypothetical protein
MHWHHITGLLFGVVLSTWIFSGLMSMNPLGAFDPKGERPNQAAYRLGVPGAVRPGLSTTQALSMLGAARIDVAALEWRVLAGRPYLLASSVSGSTRLVVANATAFEVIDRWPEAAMVDAGARLMAARLASSRSLRDYDRFYYQRQAASMYGASERRLPVLRLEFEDTGRTVVYLDPFTGDMALSVDRSQRVGRWLFNLLHSWDLPTLLRFASAREAALVALSVGALAIAVTGVVIGYRRIMIFVGQRVRMRRMRRMRRMGRERAGRPELERQRMQTPEQP